MNITDKCLALMHAVAMFRCQRH